MYLLKKQKSVSCGLDIPVGVIIALVFLVLSLTARIASAYDYSDYSRDYTNCAKRGGPGLADCQKKAKIKFECSKEADWDACVAERDADLAAQIQLDKEANAREEQRRSENYKAWTKEVEARLGYGIGDWTVKEGEPDPIDDSRVVHVFLKADSGSAGLSNEPITLYIACRSNKTSVYINWNDYITDSSIVTHRFDKEKPITADWPSSTDKSASFYYGAGSEFAQKLMTTDKFVARTTPYNENPVTAIFDTRGLSKAIEPLRDACEW